MTNLTSEQYRDVLARTKNPLIKDIPSVQHLLRLSVQNFFKRFGYYPDVAGVGPGKIGILGDQTEFCGGMAFPVATPMVTIMVGKLNGKKEYCVISSADVKKPHKITFSSSKKRPLKPGFPSWLDHVKCIMRSYPEEQIPGFDALIESNLPLGVGFGSSAALEVAVYTFLEVLIGKKASPKEKAEVCQRAEAEFFGKEVGLVERLTSAAGKDRNAILIDCKTNEYVWVPFWNPDVVLLAVDSHCKDELMGDEYKDRAKYINKAVEMMKVENLRDCTEEDFTNFENNVMEIIEQMHNEETKANEKDEHLEMEVTESQDAEENEVWDSEKLKLMLKRAKFFIPEMTRIKDAIEAWTKGDIETFGKKLTESHYSLIEDFELHCPYLDFLVDTSLEVEGVFGSRIMGMGLGYGGGIVTLLNKNKLDSYVNTINRKFFEQEEKNRLEFEENWKQEHTLRMEEKEQEEIRRNKEDNDHIRSNQKQDEEKLSKIGTLQEVSSKESTQPEYPSKQPPTFYIITPFSGARMMFVTKSDYLRSIFATPVPDPKILMKKAAQHYEDVYGRKAEVGGLAPASIVLFGEFMEFHFGNFFQMALPMMTAVVGGKNDSVYFSFKTTSPHIEDQNQIKYPVPCVRSLVAQESEWANYVIGAVSHFKGHVPGFDAVIESSVPCHVGLHSCSALQAGVYTFLEGLTKIYTNNLFEKADRCERSEWDFLQYETRFSLMQRCSVLKYFPTLMCKEGHGLFIDSKKNEIHHYFIDDPSYVFLVGTVKNITSDLTVSDLEARTRLCLDAAEILGKSTLRDAQKKHLRCLVKRDADEEMVRRARYVIMEHERTNDAVEAIKNNDYERLGLLMSQSHKSLRDDFGVSCPELENLVALASQVDGVLGAKMVGKGFTGSVVILVRTPCADDCIRYMRKKYVPKDDKPVFYVTKPSSGAFVLNMLDLERIP